MVDYAKPITPGDALRLQMRALRYDAERLRADAAMLIARAETVTKISSDLEDAADKYDEWQPKPHVHEWTKAQEPDVYLCGCGSTMSGDIPERIE